ncbi:hypothetical protein WDW89_15025 [Deltaproteobacteria bacterium TL4]
MTPAPIVLFKTEGSHVMGLGHVSRCLSLIKALPPSKTGILCVNEDALVLEFASARCGSVYSEQDVSKILEYPISAVIIDQLDRPWSLQKELCRQNQCKAIRLDYFVYDDPQADTIVNLYNQNSKCSPPTHIPYYEGLQFALIGSQFYPHRQNERIVRESLEEVLIIMGGADPSGKTMEVLSFLNQLPIALRLNVVVGPLCPHGKLIEEIATHSPHLVKIHRSPANLPELMAAADLAISGCGTTSFELSYVGTPAIVLAQNEMEQRFCVFLESEGVAWNGHKSLRHAWELALQSEARSLIMKRQMIVFDGKGAQRILNIAEVLPTP